MYSISPRIRDTLVSQRLSRLQHAKQNRHVDLGFGKTLFYCPSCATWRRGVATTKTYLTPSFSSQENIILQTSRARANQSSYLPKFYYASSGGRLFSSAINAVGSRRVPARFRELYDALNEIRDTAVDHVSLSRLQLAIRGLESEVPVIRVAVLGLNDITAPRRLVRLLLSDPLKPKEPWEELLEPLATNESQAVLIKYGEDPNQVEENLVTTLFIPSPILKRGNVEILVSSLGIAQGPPDVAITRDAVFTPTITIPTSHSGRNNLVRYPVHKTILCGTGLDGLLDYNGLLSRVNLGRESSSVRVAIEKLVAELDAEGGRAGVTFVDTKQAIKALASFRESVRNATEYEQGWSASNVQPLVDWLSAIGSRERKTPLEPALQTLIESILDAAEKEESLRTAQRMMSISETSTTSEEVRRGLERTVSAWAERAHTELQNSLEEGFASIRWRGLAWWKLFWRGDDVSMITSEILEQRYLPQAERELIWTAGKVKQAGLMKEPRDLEDLPRLSGEVKDVDRGPRSEIEPAPVEVEQPWPMKIAISRFQLGNSTIPSLQALSQRLVMYSISTTALTSALSTLLYVSESASLYGSGTVAAVGLVYSLRRQQQKWETARSFWEGEVRETGRQALHETEILLRGLIQGAKGAEPVVAENKASLAIDRARKALEGLKNDDQ